MVESWSDAFKAQYSHTSIFQIILVLVYLFVTGGWPR